VRRARLPIALAAALAVGAAGCADEVITPLRAPPVPGAGGPDGGGPVGPCDTTLAGYATVDGGTTGGQDGPTVVVSNAMDLKTSANSTDPLTIEVSGMITLTGQIRVRSFKTIVGVGPASGFTGGGLNISDEQNVIVRNLVIAKVVSDDAVSLSGAKHVWVDHCDLSSDLDHDKTYYDGLVDITHGSDDVTVSWTVFRDHYHPSLIGHSDDNGAEDTGHLTVTFHHNLFQNTYSYNPTIRFGSLHAYDNLYRNVLFSGISSRMGAQVLAEENTFDAVQQPLTTHFESPTDGFLENKDNVFINVPTGSTVNITQTSTWTPPYAYAAEPAAAAATAVLTCAGTGKI
jgi:pectate lyase